MRALEIARPGEPLTVLCLGAHSDDIEIGAGGTLLTWIAGGARLDVHWCVLSATGPRADEAGASAEAFLAGAASKTIELAAFQDGYFPYRPELKDWFEGLKQRVRPDVILTHRRDDGHQDHREICRLTSNSFRDHLILEYEVPKWDGDLGQPNMYVPLSAEIMARKCDLLDAHFGSQRSKDWFDAETFRGLARLRGMECRAPERFAEGFFVRKALLG
ncbi:MULTISPECIES: PIG-L deacetylase family protein [Rhodomicrobium]|uniref:PIG-L deacetylase family protein n=1 Tax=Rhodomicrobium TaxID=1068 RepID=UPI000B4AF726|nr:MULTISPECIES: PIG-L deacetylase family protein [Rhodomicrobium]